MPTILTIAEIIEIGRATTYLSANYTSRQQLFGGNVTKPAPPVQIAIVTDALDWGNAGGAQTAQSLRSTANYLYWLCGMFQLQAQNAINGPGGGSVIPITPTMVTPNPYDFEVSAISFPLANGGSSVTLDGTGGTQDYRGFNVELLRGGLGQNTTNTGSSYYTWNKVTGLFSISPAVVTGELIRISPSV